MSISNIQLSTSFKFSTRKAIYAIILFVFTYIILLLLAMALTALCIYAGLMLIITVPRFLTIALGIGLASLGVLIMIFLLKFMFKSHKTDRSHLLEIKQKDEPKLFELIDEIVNKVDTQFPKKVYLSHEVNASVFYDSNFWSMFLPTKKNLVIGVGLVNSINQSELKAILGHEFGHFSQKTMKVGSFVYNVNQVIYNMLYDNSSYENLVDRWASVSSYISIFVVIAVKIIEGIQWILQKVYEIVNRNYMGLSREMEFHADEIAAHVTGYEPLKTSLLRMELADSSLQSVFNFYENKIQENITTRNIFENHAFALQFMAAKNKVPILNGLPNITEEVGIRFNKSKFTIEDQWASHPSVSDRINRLENTNLSATTFDLNPANNIFIDITNTQVELTKNVFKQIKYSSSPNNISNSDFELSYKAFYDESTFPDLYNSYYDSKNPYPFEISELDTDEELKLGDLFSDEKTDLVYSLVSLEKDIENLMHIVEKRLKVKTFDYDGIKYEYTQASPLVVELRKKLEGIIEIISNNDKKIYQYFLTVENNTEKSPKLSQLYEQFFDFDKSFDAKFDIYHQMHQRLEFTHRTTGFDQIRANFSDLKPFERALKNQIKELISSPYFSNHIHASCKESFDLYLSKDWNYFKGETYLEKNLEILFAAINHYANAMSELYLTKKREILLYQVDIENTVKQAVK